MSRADQKRYRDGRRLALRKDGLPRKRRTPKPGRISEKQLQAGMVNFARQIGCRVLTRSEPRSVMQSEGQPDLMIRCLTAVRRRCVPPGRTASFTVEVKTPDGVMSDAQIQYAEEAEQCGEAHFVGGWNALAAGLRWCGLLNEADATPQPAAQFPLDWRSTVRRAP